MSGMSEASKYDTPTASFMQVTLAQLHLPFPVLTD